MKLPTPVLLSLSLLVVSAPVISADDFPDRNSQITPIVYDLLLHEQFAKVEQKAEEYRRTKARSSAGLWKLAGIYSGVAQLFVVDHPDDVFWKQREDLVAKWIRAYPNSPTPHLAYVNLFASRAWNERGFGFANTVRPEAWKSFRNYLEQARVYAEKTKNIAGSDPEWYVRMAYIANAQEWPEQRFESLVAEAIDKEPLYYDTYLALVQHYYPKWGGNAELVEKFARRALAKTQAQEGYGIYARIYAYASTTQYCDDLFTDSLVDWPTMKKGIDDIVAQYKNNYTFNQFAYLACQAGDQPETSLLLARIEQPLPEPWAGENHYAVCKAWAGQSILTAGKSRPQLAYNCRSHQG
jgi:hypothetical protein